MGKNEAAAHYKLLTEINTKWIKDLHIRSKTVKLLEDSIGEGFKTLDLASILWHNTESTDNHCNNTKKNSLHLKILLQGPTFSGVKRWP